MARLMAWPNITKRIAALEASHAEEVARLKAVIERDRSQAAEYSRRIRRALTDHEWLRLGRGSYEYDDDRWKDEFAEVFDKVTGVLDDMWSLTGDRTDCPETTEEVIAARAEPEPPRCHAARDGDCIWQHCPQLRDGEPAHSGRHCPLDIRDEEEPA